MEKLLVQKVFSDLPSHSNVTVDLDFVKIDSWDNECFYVYADDAHFDQIYYTNRWVFC